MPFWATHDATLLSFGRVILYTFGFARIGAQECHRHRRWPRPVRVAIRLWSRTELIARHVYERPDRVVPHFVRDRKGRYTCSTPPRA